MPSFFVWVEVLIPLVEDSKCIGMPTWLASSCFEAMKLYGV